MKNNSQQARKLAPKFHQILSYLFTQNKLFEIFFNWPVKPKGMFFQIGQVFKNKQKIFSMSKSSVSQAPPYHQRRTNKITIAFAISLLLDQVLVCLIYGLLYDFNSDILNATQPDAVLLVAVMTIMVIVGFGLLNAYITNASVSGMSMTLLIFVLSVEHYFLLRAFWDKAGTEDPNSEKQWDNYLVNKISLVNVGQDRFETHLYSHYSFVDAIACALANVVAFSSLVGRVQLLEVFYLAVFGTFFYEINSQLIWRFMITDIGYGMRIFLFGGVLGFISSLILGVRNKINTFEHPRYLSIYATRCLGLIGLVIIFSTFPSLCVAGLYQTSTNNGYILYVAPFNMWFALVAGVLGSFCACALTYRKIFIHDLIFSGINGGIIFSSSSDLHRNPAVPLTVGFIGGLVTTIYHSRQMRRINKQGILTSLGHLDNYVLPGFLSGVLSAILHAIGQGTFGNFVRYIHPDRSYVGQGAFQLIGILLSIAIGLFGGVLLGLMFSCLNKFTRQDYFNDALIYDSDKKDKLT